MRRIATIGFFDGVHKGHQFLFAQLCQAAQQRGLEPLVVTFRQHPREVLQSDYVPQLLTSLDERLSLIRSFVNSFNLQHLTPYTLHTFDFTEIKDLTAQQFMCLLRDQYDVSAILMGYDHRFGSDRLRHPQDYKRIGEQEGIEVLTLSEFTEGELHVSSTEIRQALERGNIVLANELLGRPYQLSGTVVHGNAIGRTIGFPTANICPDDPYKILPKNGVYKVTVSFNLQHSTFNHLQSQPAIANIGHSLGQAEQTLELHIPHWSGDLYGEQLTIAFDRFLRDERHFDSLASLRQQIAEDLSSAITSER